MTHWQKLEVKWVEHGNVPVTVYHLSGILTNSPESYAFLDQILERVRKGTVAPSSISPRWSRSPARGSGSWPPATPRSRTRADRCASAAFSPGPRHPQRGRLLTLVGEEPTEEAAIRRVSA